MARIASGSRPEQEQQFFPVAGHQIKDPALLVRRRVFRKSGVPTDQLISWP
ncbi:hypothetical protein V6L76_19295 [Pannonibacter sp. Pt2]|uniref:Transposase n=1 Tax=Pannonibacter anstelovis TaxID=3121537 RepID=A0ABU7ZT73_9HYPH